MRRLRTVTGLAMMILMITASLSEAQEWQHNPNWARPVHLPGSDNLYEVTPDFYRSAQTDADAFKEYEKFGIKTVINLRNFHSDRDEVRGTSLNLVEIPINTWSIKDEEIIAALWHIKNEPAPVMIHCMHGADRTGTVVAMYRMVYQNWTLDEAMDELINGGYGYHSIWSNIPKYLKMVNVEKIRQAVQQENQPPGARRRR